MCFIDAERNNQKFSGITKLLKTALEVPSYIKNPAQIFDNMNSDPQIVTFPSSGANNSRLDLLELIHRSRHYSSAIPILIKNFCISNQRQGPVSSNVQIPILCRVQSEKALIFAISHHRSSIGPTSATDLVQELLAPNEKIKMLAMQKLNLTGIQLSCYQMWSFIPKDHFSPFDEIVSRDATVDLLGLGPFHGTTEQLVRWVHQIPTSTVAFTPTAWDAGHENPYWRPGGFTCHLSNHRQGVPEVVHESIRGESLIHPIERIP